MPPLPALPPWREGKHLTPLENQKKRPNLPQERLGQKRLLRRPDGLLATTLPLIRLN